jgi:hypothetical protein
VTLLERHSFDVRGLGHGQVLIYEYLGTNVLVQCDALAVAASPPGAQL